jgi:hypothetical protein
MAADIIERLKDEARNPEHYCDNRPLTAARLLSEAASTIERLRGEVERLKDVASGHFDIANHHNRRAHEAEARALKAESERDEAVKALKIADALISKLVRTFMTLDPYTGGGTTASDRDILEQIDEERRPIRQALSSIRGGPKG